MNGGRWVFLQSRGAGRFPAKRRDNSSREQERSFCLAAREIAACHFYAGRAGERGD